MSARNIFPFHEYNRHLKFEFFFFFYNEKLLQHVKISWLVRDFWFFFNWVKLTGVLIKCSDRCEKNSQNLQINESERDSRK